MSDYPWQPIKVAWQRPAGDKETMSRCTRRSDLLGLAHSLGTLAILTATGTWAYLMYAGGHWVWLAVALYVHGGVHAFNPQVHELVHRTVFRSKWLNALFGRVFGLVFWTQNAPLFWLSHTRHHQYTLHRASEGEEVHPRPEMTEQIVAEAVRVVDPAGLLLAVYDKIRFMITPFLRNPRRNTWQRYVYSQASPRERRDVYWTEVGQFLFHVAFGVAAVASGHWFLIVVVSLPAFYGGKWYHTMVHDTMHVGREPETDDFRKCCRDVRLDPITSFLFWHMEYHTEHHTFAAVPCYRLKRLRKAIPDHWEPRQGLAEAWSEMNRHSRKLLAMTEAEPAGPVEK